MSRNRHHRYGNTASNNVPGNRPQDHRPAQGKPRTFTVKGISLTIDPKVLDDWEFVESLYDLQADPEGNALQIIPFLRRLLGDSYGKAKNELRGADGRIDGETMGAFLNELFEEMSKAFPNS